MSERASEIDRINARVQSCIERIGDGATFGTVTVVYHEPDWTYAQAVLKATCNACDATSTMRANGYPIELKYLAFVVSEYRCDPLMEHPVIN